MPSNEAKELACGKNIDSNKAIFDTWDIAQEGFPNPSRGLRTVKVLAIMTRRGMNSSNYPRFKDEKKVAEFMAAMTAYLGWWVKKQKAINLNDDLDHARKVEGLTGMAGFARPQVIETIATLISGLHPSKSKDAVSFDLSDVFDRKTGILIPDKKPLFDEYSKIYDTVRSLAKEIDQCDSNWANAYR
jgi:hypothetical protein